MTSPEFGSVEPEPPFEDGVVLSEGSVEPDPLFLELVEPGSVAIGSSPSEVETGSLLSEPGFEEVAAVPSDGADVLSVVEEELSDPLSAVPVEDSAGAEVASDVADEDPDVDVPEVADVPAVVVVVASLDPDVVVVEGSVDGDSLGASTDVAS